MDSTFCNLCCARGRTQRFALKCTLKCTLECTLKRTLIAFCAHGRCVTYTAVPRHEATIWWEYRGASCLVYTLDMLRMSTTKLHRIQFAVLEYLI